MKLSKLAIGLCLSFFVSHSMAQVEDTTTTSTSTSAPTDDVDKRTTTTSTETPEGVTTTQTTDDYDRKEEGPGLGGFFIEPGIRYDNLSGELDLPAPFGVSDVEAEGVGANLRVGFHLLDVMFLAAEGNYSQMHIKNDGGDRYSADGSAHSYGPTLGFQTPWAGIRVWGTYIVNGEFDPTSHNGINLKFKDLNGYKVGLGARFKSFGASVEYQDATYNDVDVQDAGLVAGADDLDLKHTGWIGQISFPISL